MVRDKLRDIVKIDGKPAAFTDDIIWAFAFLLFDAWLVITIRLFLSSLITILELVLS
jgi:hypothetical protein